MFYVIVILTYRPMRFETYKIIFTVNIVFVRSIYGTVFVPGALVVNGCIYFYYFAIWQLPRIYLAHVNQKGIVFRYIG